MIYTIGIGDFESGETVYPNRCLCAGIGGEGLKSETIPWEGTANNPWDYKWENDTFVLDPIELPPEPEPEPTPEERIAELEAALSALLKGETE